MRHIHALFLVYLFVFPLFGEMAIAADGDASNPDPRTLIETPAQREAGTGPIITPPPVAQVNAYVCDSSALKPDETQNIIDLLKNGFTGKEIAGQTEKDTEREKLAANELVLTKPDDEDVAVKTQIPNEKFKPWEVSQFLNNSINGPFAFGVVLEDSLRAGRCETYSSQDCALLGKNLTYRNSGAGIVANFKPIKEAITDFGNWFEGNEDLPELTKEKNQQLRTAVADDGVDEVKIKTATRLEKELLPNTILTNFFEAKLETNCNSSACVISTYSLFDKYFNSWMSSEMVVSTFGPSLLYQTKKLFGWTGRRGFFGGVLDEYEKFLDRIRREYIAPEHYLFNVKTKRINAKLDKYGWRAWWEETVGGSSDGTGYYLFKTEEFQHWWGKAQEKGGFLEHIKTSEEKAEFIRMLKDIRSVLRAGKTNVDIAESAYNQALKNAGEKGFSDPVVRDRYLNYGQEVIRYMDDYYDEGLGADYIEWITRYPNAGFYDKGVKQVLPDGGSDVINLFHDHRNTRQILRKIKDDGTYKGFEGQIDKYKTVFESRGDDLVLYHVTKENTTSSTGLSYSNVKAAAGNRADNFIEDIYGNMVPYNTQSYGFIQNRLTANAQVYTGNWSEWGTLSPLDTIARIDNARTGSNLKMGVVNIEQMLNTVQERNWTSRRYWNALDKLIAQEDELVRSYFTVKGGVKWTALPFGYWWAKKGFGIEGISQYQLPETWHRLKFTIGEQNIYDYAYIDFFANEGSDQGDIFIQVINKLPWKLILDELSDKYNPVKDLYNKITQNELRNETENLAFYFSGPEECTNCSMVVRSEDLATFRPFFFIGDQKVVSYLLEDTVSEEAREKGQTLIMFGSRTNLEGQSGSGGGEPVDLVRAIEGEDVKTCAEAIEGLEFYGLNVGKVLPKNASVGGVLAGLESITYGTFFWAGIFSTAAIQIVIAPQLHGCVDVDEGYYAHYFVPVKKETDKKANATVKSTEKVSNMVSKFKENFVDTFRGSENSITKESAEKIGTEIDKFVKDSKSNDIVQATLRLEGLSSGQLDSRALFYFWCGKGCEINPANYKTQGAEQVRGTNGVNVDIDFEKGVIRANGTQIVESPDNVRLASTNLNIPATEIPQRITETCIENTTEAVIEISADGIVKVVNPDLLRCLQMGVIEQTGLPLPSDRLNDAFGKLDSVVTTTHPNIRTLGDKIIAEGVPRKIADGRSSSVVIYANKEVHLVTGSNQSESAGILQSLQFANGVVIVKPNGCFIAWLKHHEDGILSKDLVDGLRTQLEREYNPQTQCEDPAINFGAIPDPGSDFQTDKVNKFNTALSHQGPFTVFETPAQRFVISAEKNANGVCEDHLRVVDKNTGKVTDYVGTITQTPDGLKIRTNDGQEHDLRFSTKDGAPFVQLDQNKPEALTAAQGKNGSFYYDPDKGLWIAENAQLLPLIEAFREGIAAKVQPNGETTATASGNVLNLDLGKSDSGLLNLPSLPENKLVLLVFLSLMIVSFIAIEQNRKNKK